MSMEIASGGASDASSLVEASLGAGVGSGVPAVGLGEAVLGDDDAAGRAVDIAVGASEEPQPPVARTAARRMSVVPIFIDEPPFCLRPHRTA